MKYHQLVLEEDELEFVDRMNNIDCIGVTKKQAKKIQTIYDHCVVY